MKTNLGEYQRFEIDCGYTEGKDWQHKKFRTYKMTYFSIMDEKDGLYVKSDKWDETNREWTTDYDFHNKITEYFNSKIQADTDLLKKRYKEIKKLDNMKTDFAD